RTGRAGPRANGSTSRGSRPAVAPTCASPPGRSPATRVLAMSPATPPSGDQLTIEADGYRAAVTESGRALRLLEHRGRSLVGGFGADQVSSGGRGQLLVPWPNRIRDGAYRFGDRELQLGLTDPGTLNASHGLVRWVAWRPLAHAADAVELG